MAVAQGQVIVSLDDFLDTFDFSKRNYTARDVYDFHLDLKRGGYSSVAALCRKHNISRAGETWARGKKIPHVMKQVKALEKLDILPLTDASELFPYIKQLVAYLMFSGSLSKDKRNDHYRCRLTDDIDRLNNAAEVIRREFGFNVNIRQHTVDNSFSLEMSSSRDGLSEGVARLLLAADFHLGKKNTQSVSVPDLIDNDTLIYYAFKLRPKKSHGNCYAFYLWEAEPVIAQATMNNFLQRLDNSLFNFVGRTYDVKRPNTIVPVISIDVAQRPVLDMLLRNYQSLYGV
jgi:hypothetical protein